MLSFTSKLLQMSECTIDSNTVTKTSIFSLLPCFSKIVESFKMHLSSKNILKLCFLNDTVSLGEFKIFDVQTENLAISLRSQFVNSLIQL